VTHPSITPTYDSRETGPAYWVTTTIDGRPVGFQRPVDDPFGRTTVRVGWRDLLRGLMQRGLTVEVTVGGDPERVNDVLELDSNQLVRGRTRAGEFRQELHRAMSRMVTDEAFEEIVAADAAQQTEGERP